MEFNYNVTGERRKALVTTISEVLGMKAVYKGMPTAAYAIDNLTVTKEGTLIADERTDEATLNKVLATLADAGFTTEAPDGADAELLLICHGALLKNNGFVGKDHVKP